jgi:predicted nucleic acid-binding protein
MLKIYLDTCSIQRPLDSKTQIRIILEAEAVLGILALCESGMAELISSDVLTFEIARTPNIARRKYALEVLTQMQEHVSLNLAIEDRARELHTRGIKPLDALHLAAAEAASADYLCTCDDRFLKRARTIAGITVQVIGPVELIGELER